MSLVNRGIIFPLVALVLGAAPLGCAAPSALDDDDTATAAAECTSDHKDLVNAIGLNAEQEAKLAEIHAEHAKHHDAGAHHAHHRPTIDQIVQWFTVNLDLTPAQAAKLRTYLEAHMPGAGMSAPAHT
jgi:hypothetical protein